MSERYRFSGRRRAFEYVAALSLGALAMPSFAQFAAHAGDGADVSSGADQQAVASDGSPLKVGGVMVYPSLGLRMGYDDNVTLAARDEIGSSFTSIRPGLAAEYADGGDRYALSYLGDFVRYQDSPEDDADNHTLRLEGSNVFTARNALNWQVTITDGFDSRGSTDRYDELDTVPAEPDHYRLNRAGGTYAYGAEGAMGRVELDAFVSNKRYLNNRDTTRTADVDQREVALRFFYRLMPKTSLVLEAGNTESDYTASGTGLDSSERRYMLGANWSATAATTGRLRFGQHTRDYKGDRDDYKGLGWEAEIDWKPRSYSTFTFSTGRRTSDPAASLTSTNFVLSTSYGLSWRHEWSGQLHTRARYEHDRAEYDKRAGRGRTDGIDTWTVGVYYDFRRWMSTGLEHTHKRRDSNDPRYDYVQRETNVVLDLKF